MVESYLGAGKGNVTGKGVTISNSGRVSGGSSQKGGAQPALVSGSWEEFAKAKAEADALKAARAAELKARGGVPVSAAERTQLAQAQAYKYGVGVAQANTPVTIKDEGQKTTLTQADVARMQAEHFTGQRSVPNPREYGQTEIIQRPMRTDVVEATKRQPKPQNLITPEQLQQQNGYMVQYWRITGNNIFYSTLRNDIILGLVKNKEIFKEGQINIAYKPVWYKEPTAYLTDISERLAYKANYLDKSPLFKIGAGFGTIGLGILKIPIGYAESTIKLRESIIGTYQLTKQAIQEPFPTFAKVGETLNRNPGDIVGQGFGMWGFGKITPQIISSVSRNIQKLSPNYVALEATGINYVEATTIPAKLSELKALEGQKTQTIHITTSDIFKGGNKVLLEQQETGAKGFRLQNDLMHFYSSIKNRAYLAYAGISGGAETASSKIKFSLFQPKIRALTEEVIIHETPKNLKGLREINIWQSQQSGKVMIPAENIVGVSTEGQLITPAKLKNIQSPGTILEKSGKPVFTFYQETTQRTGTWLDNVFGSGWHKIEIQPVKRVAVTERTTPPPIPKLDIVEYARQQSISSSTKYVTPSDILSRMSVLSKPSTNKNYKSSSSKPYDLAIQPPVSSEKIASSSEITPSISISPKYDYSVPYPARYTPYPRSRTPPSTSVPGRSGGGKYGGDLTSTSTATIPQPSLHSPPKLTNFETPKLPPVETPKLHTHGWTKPQQAAGKFFVVFREFGREVKATARPMTLRQAEMFGRDITKQSLTASYKVVPTYMANLPQATRVKWAAGEWVSPFRFTEGKTKATKGFKVEIPKFRIGGLGAKVELKESREKKKKGG